MTLATFRLAFRYLRRSPGFTLIGLTSLAVGIGATTAMFSIFNAVVLRPLPFAASDRLVWVSATAPGDPEESVAVSFPDFLDWRRQVSTFSSLAAFSDARLYLTRGEVPERVSAALVSPEVFATLGVQPRLGRPISEVEGRPGGARVVLVGEDLWRRRFDAKPDLVGQAIEINREPYTVVGIMPASFRFPEYAEMWLPLALRPDGPRDRGTLFAVGRLAPGASLGRAQEEMSQIAKRLAQAYPAANSGRGAKVQLLRRYYVGDTAAAALVFLVATGLVLLVACANLASLLLARFASRRREMSMRAAVGAGRGDLLWQLLAESLLMGVLGAIAGLPLAIGGLRLLVRSIPIVLPFWADFGVDGRVLAFVLGLSLATSLVFGLAPALHGSRPDLNEGLKDGAGGAGQPARARWHQLLVVAEVAVSMAVLVSAGLMVRGFLRLQEVATGFQPAGAASAVVVPASSPLDIAARASQGSQSLARLRQVLEAVGRAAGVTSVAAAGDLPLRGGARREFTVEGAAPKGGASPSALVIAVSAHYFETLGIPLRAGRAIDDRDGQGRPLAAVVNARLASKSWPGADPVGRHLKLARWDREAPWIEVVGVAGDVRQLGLDSHVPAAIYVPLEQNPRAAFYLFWRSAQDPERLAGKVRAAVRGRVPELQVDSVEGLDRFARESLWRPALYSWLLSIFAAVTLLLALVGVYGVVAFSVSQRTREIGIRMALGARRRAVLQVVAGRVLVRVAVGVAVGTVASVALGDVLGSMLAGFGPFDAILPGVLTLAFLGVAALASYLPSRRALRLDPAKTLRVE
jgi:putative ABC transport system permease protein